MIFGGSDVVHGADPVFAEVEAGDTDLIAVNGGSRAHCIGILDPGVYAGIFVAFQGNAIGGGACRQCKLGSNDILNHGLLGQGGAGAAGFDITCNLLEDAVQSARIGCREVVTIAVQF